MRFDLTDLRLFLAVVEAGSITRGASEVGLSLSAASERIREMEVTGGVRLLARRRHGVVPTQAGEALLDHARVVTLQVARLRDEIGQFSKGVRSTIRMLANTAAITEFLPTRLAPWLADNPQVDIDIVERQSADVARGVAIGFGDIGVLSGAVDTAGLALRPFAKDKLVLVAARTHPLAGSGAVRFADLAGHPFIALANGALQAHLDLQAVKSGLSIRPRIRLRSFEDICRMAGDGVGIGIVPETAAKRWRQAANIAVIQLADHWANRSLSLCVRAGVDLPPLTRSLMNHLEREHAS